MELIIYNKANTCTCQSGERTIKVDKQGFVITFSERVSRELNWKKDTRIIFAQDSKKVKQWFIASPKSNNEGAFILRSDNNSRLRFGGRGIVEHIVNSIDASQVRIKFLVGTKPEVHGGVEYYPLVPAIVETIKRKL